MAILKNSDDQEPPLAFSRDLDIPRAQLCDLCHREWWRCGHRRRHLHYVPVAEKS